MRDGIHIVIPTYFRCRSSQIVMNEPADEQYTPSLKRKCCHFDEILITDCTESCHFDNFRCSQWLKFRQNDDISVSVFVLTQCIVPDIDYTLSKQVLNILLYELVRVILYYHWIPLSTHSVLIKGFSANVSLKSANKDIVFRVSHLTNDLGY